MAACTHNFLCALKDQVKEQAQAIHTMIIAGWTGRDQAKVDEHIAELAALGVAPPASTPCFYRVAASNLTTAEHIQVAGTDSTGEAEAVMVALADGMWVGVGSDHTDRVLEATGVTLSKQVCPKPIGSGLWRVEDIADHWDEVVLRSEATIDGKARTYQEGTLAAMRTPRDLLARYGREDGRLDPGTAMFCGTLPVIGGIEFASRFRVVLEDPVLNRKIEHSYEIEPLPIIG